MAHMILYVYVSNVALLFYPEDLRASDPIYYRVGTLGDVWAVPGLKTWLSILVQHIKQMQKDLMEKPEFFSPFWVRILVHGTELGVWIKNLGDMDLKCLNWLLLAFSWTWYFTILFFLSKCHEFFFGWSEQKLWQFICDICFICYLYTCFCLHLGVLKVVRTDFEVVIVPRASVEAVSAHALLLTGNVTLMFVEIAGLGMFQSLSVSFDPKSSFGFLCFSDIFLFF